MSGSKKRITVQFVNGGSGINRITALCGSNINETRTLVGTKLGLPNPAACKLFNKHGAEIDDVDLILPDDFLFASAGEPILPQISNPAPVAPVPILQQAPVPVRLSPAGSAGPHPASALPTGVASTIMPFAASTIAGDGESSADSKDDHFEMGRVLGVGGQGTTYLATDRRTGTPAVLKQIFCAGLSETNKAIEEAMMLSRLKHPRVVTYNEVFLGKDSAKGNYVGIVMEYCAGGDLYQMLCRQRSKKKPISVRRVKMWIVQLCEALNYLHMMKVIHRDVKPMNVLLDADGDLKMADFGLARQGVSPSKLAMTQCGTPGYESPEVQMGQGYDFKTDVWGLGCVVCDMTTLKFMHERPGSLATQVQVDPKAIVKVIQAVMELYGPDLHGLLASMLQADPKRRPSAAEILEYKFLRPSPISEAEPQPARGPVSGSPPPMKSSSPAPQRQVEAHTSTRATASPANSPSAGEAPGQAKDRNSSSPVNGRQIAERKLMHCVPGTADQHRRSHVVHEGSQARQESTAPANLELKNFVGASIGAVGIGCTASTSVESSVSIKDERGSQEILSSTPSVPCSGETLVVSTKPSRGEFGSICEALRSASDGMVIEIMEGKYQEEIVLDKMVTLRARRTRGEEAVLVEIIGSSARPVLSCKAAMAAVSGVSLLHVARISSEGRECTRCVDVAAGRLWMQDCNVTSACGVGLVVRDAARLEASRCRVSRCGQNGLFLFERGGAKVEDCDFFENAFPGIGMDQSVDTLVRRCKIRRGKGDGVKIYGGQRIVVEGNDISHNAQVGISIEDHADPIIRHNTIHDGNSCGISVLGGSKGLIENNDIFCNAHPNVYISTGADPVIRANQIHHSGSCGVTCVDEGIGTIENNEIYANQSVGVYVMNRANPNVRNNTIRDGEADGVAIVFAGRGCIEANNISGNAGIGILVESEAEPRIQRNQINDAHSDGIRVCDNGNGLIEANSVVSAGRGPNGGCGIVITKGSSPTVRDNLVRECVSHGVVISLEARGVVERNTVCMCQGSGIVVSRQADPVIRGNLVRDNAGVGIWVCKTGRGTVTDNRLVSNRGPQQLLVESGAEASVRDNAVA